MRSPRSVSLGVLVLATGAATAYAATVTETGKIIGVSKSSVSARVTIKGGKPTKISSLRFKGVPAKCDGGNLKQNLSPIGVGIVQKDGSFMLQAMLPRNGGTITVKGKVAADGKSASGGLTFDTSSPPPAGECKGTNKRWKIRAG